MEFSVDSAGNVLFAQKEGINAGVSAVLRRYPDQNVNVVLLANSQQGYGNRSGSSIAGSREETHQRKEHVMYAAIRRIKVQPGVFDEAVQRDESGLVPLLSGAPGFVEFALVQGGEDVGGLHQSL